MADDAGDFFFFLQKLEVQPCFLGQKKDGSNTESPFFAGKSFINRCGPVAAGILLPYWRIIPFMEPHFIKSADYKLADPKKSWFM